MQTGASRLKLCVRTLGATLRNSGREVSSCRQPKQQPILSESNLIEGNSRSDYLGRQVFNRLVREDSPEAASQKRFRIIVPAEASVRELKSLIAVQFRKLYPEEDPLLVRYIREDGVDCDLDDDFSVGDFFTTDSFVLALCETIVTGPATSATSISSCEAIAMPRPLVTPMSEIGDIFHKELLSPPPAPDAETMSSLPPLAKPLAKSRKRRRKEKAGSREVMHGGQPTKKLATGNPSVVLATGNKPYGKVEKAEPLLADLQASCPAANQQMQPFSPITASQEKGPNQTFDMGSDETDLKPAVKINSGAGKSCTEPKESPQKQTTPQSPPTHAGTSGPKPIVSSVLTSGEVREVDVASLIQAARSPSSSDEGEEEADLTIPVVESKLTMAMLRSLARAAPTPASSAPISSEAEENYLPQMDLATVTGPSTTSTHRTSLTALTEELRRSSAASPIPPVATKILAPINANNPAKPKRRRNQGKREAASGPVASPL